MIQKKKKRHVASQCLDFLEYTVVNGEGMDIRIIKSNSCFSEIMAEEDTVCCLIKE